MMCFLSVRCKAVSGEAAERGKLTTAGVRSLPPIDAGRDGRAEHTQARQAKRGDAGTERRGPRWRNRPVPIVVHEKGVIVIADACCRCDPLPSSQASEQTLCLCDAIKTAVFLSGAKVLIEAAPQRVRKDAQGDEEVKKCGADQSSLFQPPSSLSLLRR